MSENKTILNKLYGFRVIPVIRTKVAENAVTAVQWLSEAGFRTFEITLTTPDAIKIIARLISKTDALIGAGTVTSVNQAKQCIEAGAQYIVSPCVVPDLPAICHQYDIPCILGACTPTELHLAMEAEADAIKIFPVSLMGGLNLYQNIIFNIYWSTSYPHRWNQTERSAGVFRKRSNLCWTWRSAGQ